MCCRLDRLTELVAAILSAKDGRAKVLQQANICMEHGTVDLYCSAFESVLQTVKCTPKSQQAFISGNSGQVPKASMGGVQIGSMKHYSSGSPQFKQNWAYDWIDLHALRCRFCHGRNAVHCLILLIRVMHDQLTSIKS